MKNIRKHKILAWILAAVLMITSCPASVFADVITTESGAEQQAVLTEGEPESSAAVVEEAPAEAPAEEAAAEEAPAEEAPAEEAAEAPADAE